jgi:hypothetical protein
LAVGDHALQAESQPGQLHIPGEGGAAPAVEVVASTIQNFDPGSVKRYLDEQTDPAEKTRRIEEVMKLWREQALNVHAVGDVLREYWGEGTDAGPSVHHRGAENALRVNDQSDWDAKMDYLERREIPSRNDVKLLYLLRRWVNMGKRMLIMTADASGTLKLEQEVGDIIATLPKSRVPIELVVLHDASIAKLLDVLDDSIKEFDFIMFSGHCQSSSTGGRGASRLSLP